MSEPALTSGEAKDAATNPEDDVEMTFFEHLGELRNRLVRALAGLLPGMALGWIFSEQIFEELKLPLNAAYLNLELGEPQIIFTDPTDAFVAYLQIAVVTGVLTGAPWIAFQAWQFVAPGLYRSEKRLAIPFALASGIFFAGGALFGFYGVFGLALETLLGVGGHSLVPMLTVDNYLTFTLRMLVAFGVTFEVPVVISFLAFAGIVDWKQLVAFFRWWLLLSGVISAVITPPDVGSMLMMLVPLNVLYGLSIILAAIFGPTPGKARKIRIGPEPDEEEEDQGGTT